MELIKKKSGKHDASFVNVLRMLCKQKESIANNYKTENSRLQKLIIEQQTILNKLNKDNMTLNRNNSELKSKNILNKSAIKYSSKQSKEELIEQNKSLKEQLLVSQTYGASMLKELTETRKQLKTISKKTIHNSKKKNP